MASPQAVLKTLFQVGTFAGLSDVALLDRFLVGSPDVAEAAFAVLVDRHGPMVRRTCRQVTGDYHEAEDAAQATFLILARSARSVRIAGSLGAWLHGVARRVSRRALAEAARRRARERRSAELALPPSPDPEPWPEVHEELARLPDRYRQPIILCDLEGLSYAQAGEQLGCPVRTIQTRLARGRERLRSRLLRRGIGPLAGSILSIAAPEPASAAWTEATVRLAMLWSTNGGPATAGEVPAGAGLAREVFKAMFFHKLKYAVGVVWFAAALSGAGAWPWTGSGANSTRDANAGTDAVGPGVAIKGWVAGPSGKPVVGAKVKAPMLKIREEIVTTGPDGEFSITTNEFPRSPFPLRVEAPDLAPRVFNIEIDAHHTPYLDQALQARTAQLAESSREISPALTLLRGGVVMGRVVRDGRPVPGAPLGIWGFDMFLDLPEVKAGPDGRFRFPHVPADSKGWLYVVTGSLERAGAVRPRALRTRGEEAPIDLGDIAVEPGRTVSGRVVFSDGKAVPANAEVVAGADHAGGQLRSKVDRSGRFALAGLPAGLISIAVLFPDDQFYAPAGYRLSSRNRCRDPLNTYLLMGRADRDVADLTILFEPGAQDPPSREIRIREAFEEAKAGPITGVPRGTP